MATDNQRYPETNAEFNTLLDRHLRKYPHMNLRRWKLIKSVLLSLSVLAFGVFAMLQGADPTMVAIPALLVAALVAGVEWTELVAIWAETSLEYQDRQEDDD